MTILQSDILKSAVTESNAVDLDVVVLPSVDSTNSWCLQQCESGKVLPFACFAETQTKGRGRRGKQWLMSSHSNIAMSLTWPLPACSSSIQLLPIAIAVAVAEVLEGLGLDAVQIKWPNDVFVHDKKIAGILIETKPMAASRLAVVIGVGLNYDMRDDESVSFALTDIIREVKSQRIIDKPDRQFIAATLLSKIVNTCLHIEEAAVLALDKFRQNYDYCLGQNIEVQIEGGSVQSGVAQGVTDSSELLVLINDELQTFNSADVSVIPQSRLE